MNPSASGWIKKFLNKFDKTQLIDRFSDELNFYIALKDAGFIYGVSLATLLDQPVSHLELTKEEYTKINLFHALVFSFFTIRPQGNYQEAVESIISFYKTIEKGKKSFLQKLNFTAKDSENLELILTARINEHNNLLHKASADFLTFSLLYVDILSFRVHLQGAPGLKEYAESLENTLISFTIQGLKAKNKKDEYDHLLIELFEDTSQFILKDPEQWSVTDIPSSTVDDDIEKRYFLDLCIMAVWDDRIIDKSEMKFLQRLADILSLDYDVIAESIVHLENFSKEHATKIQMFEYAHPVQQFYKQSNETVNKLIIRNRVRLLKELQESKELLFLLGQSTVRDLNSEERAKVRDQLLDIFKSIPSLAIFMLPGGMLLLPLFVKFIPKLLPSAFAENRIQKRKEESGSEE